MMYEVYVRIVHCSIFSLLAYELTALRLWTNSTTLVRRGARRGLSAICELLDQPFQLSSNMFSLANLRRSTGLQNRT